FDNTLTNMRIADVHTGVMLKSCGNSLRNIHPLYTCDDYTDYAGSTGFYDIGGNNWYSFCYSDHLGVGFRIAENRSSIFDSCYVFWYCGRGENHTAIKCEGKLDSVFNNFKIGFFNNETENVVLSVAKPDGKGVINRLSLNDPSLVTDKLYETYLQGGLF
ncbi:MAG: hypothetical protein HFE63_08855, partial [Clostridiales bacterium]|nr:hypothetical protein [Clostridiales bacterium]